MTPRLLALVGPTASGKSALALGVAETLGAEIVCADARQVYRGLDIGTAKPTPADRARVPHHCVDLVDPTAPFDAARWVAAAEVAIASATRVGRPVLVVGGTGLYVRALLRGLCPAAPANWPLRAALRERAARAGPAELRRWLARLDPAACARIHPHDGVRTERAIEVALTTGRPLSELQRAHAFATARYDARVVVVAPPPDVLAQRIAARVDAMLAAGWADEVRALVARLPPDAPGWRTLGYRELREYVLGRTDRATARDAIVQATRRYAKRQRTWWRRDGGRVTWTDPTRDGPAAIRAAARFLVANGEIAR